MTLTPDDREAAEAKFGDKWVKAREVMEFLVALRHQPQHPREAERIRYENPSRSHHAVTYCAACYLPYPCASATARQ